MSTGHRRQRRQIRCTECSGLFWLAYAFAAERPLAAAGVLCPDASCRKLNRIHLPSSAHGFHLSDRPEDWGPGPGATAEPAEGPGTEAPERTSSSASRSLVYWRPPSF